MNKLPLLANVDYVLRTHAREICSKLGVAESEIISKLDETFDDTVQVKCKRQELLAPLNAKTNIKILKILYPNDKSVFSKVAKPTRVNTAALYDEYLKHDIRSIEPKHLNAIIDHFLAVPFKRPASMLSQFENPPDTTLRGYSKQQDFRNNALRKIEKLFSDLRLEGLPISIAEQNKLLYYKFFRDDAKIMTRVSNAFESLGKELKPPNNEFTMSFYKRLQMTDTKSLNNLLRISVMQDKRDIFDDIMKTILPNRDTYNILLDVAIQRNHLSVFHQLIERIDVCWDMTIANKIIKGYVHFKDYDGAHRVLNQLVKNDDIFYQQLCIEDRDIYERYLHYYDELNKIVSIPSLQLNPNISSFEPMIKDAVEQENFRSVLKFCDDMKKFNLPIPTKIFKEIFKGKWSITQTIELIGMLIEQFEATSILDNDVNRNINSYRGELVKLSDKLMILILQQFISSSIYNKFIQVQNRTFKLKNSNPKQDLYIINDIRYIRYMFLKKLYTDSLISS